MRKIYLLIGCILIVLSAGKVNAENLGNALEMSAKASGGNYVVGRPIEFNVTINNKSSEMLLLPDINNKKFWGIFVRVFKYPNANESADCPIRDSQRGYSVESKDVPELIKLKPGESVNTIVKEVVPLLPGDYTIVLSYCNDSKYLYANPKETAIDKMWYGEKHATITLCVVDVIDEKMRIEYEGDKKALFAATKYGDIADILKKYNGRKDYYAVRLVIDAERESMGEGVKIALIKMLFELLREGYAYEYIDRATAITIDKQYPLEIRREALRCLGTLDYSVSAIGVFIGNIAYYKLSPKQSDALLHAVNVVIQDGFDPDMTSKAKEILSKITKSGK